VKTVDASEATLIIAELLESLDNAYPDVGMGRSKDFFVHQALKLLKLTPNDVIVSDIVRQMGRS